MVSLALNADLQEVSMSDEPDTTTLAARVAVPPFTTKPVITWRRRLRNQAIRWINAATKIISRLDAATNFEMLPYWWRFVELVIPIVLIAATFACVIADGAFVKDDCFSFGADITNSMFLPYMLMLTYYFNIWYRQHATKTITMLQSLSDIEITTPRQVTSRWGVVKAIFFAGSSAGVVFAMIARSDPAAWWYHNVRIGTFVLFLFTLTIAWSSSLLLAFRTINTGYTVFHFLRFLVTRGRLVHSVSQESASLLRACSTVVVTNITLAALYVTGGAVVVFSDWHASVLFGRRATIEDYKLSIVVISAIVLAYITLQSVLAMKYSEFKKCSRDAMLTTIEQEIQAIDSLSRRAKLQSYFETRKAEVNSQFSRKNGDRFNTIVVFGASVIIPLISAVVKGVSLLKSGGL